jgi:O-antigen ligase
MPLAVRSLTLAVPAVAALLGIVAVVDPVLAIVGSVAIVFGVLMLTDVAVGICLYAFASALFEGIPEFGAFSAAKALGLALALTWFATLAFRQHLRDEIFVQSPAYFGLLVCFVLWCGASTLWAENSPEATAQFIRLSLNLLIIPIAFSAIDDERTLRLLIAALLAGLLVSTLYGLFKGGVEGGDGRLTGSGLDANYLALWLIVASSLAYGIVASEGDILLRGLTFFGIGLAGLAVFATASRTGLIALASVLLVAPFIAGRGRRALAILLALLAVGAAGIYFTAFASDTIREHVSSQADGGSGRTSIWKVGVRMAEAHPVAGVGLGNFQTSSIHYLLEPGAVERSEHIVDEPKVAHNTYLQWWAETGLVGLTAYLLLVASSFVLAMRAARRFAAAGRRDSEALARAVAVAIIALSVGAFFISLQNSKPLWLLLALGPVMLKLARRQGLSA